MNKSTQKIIIIAVSVIVVIVAATAAALILPGFMNKEDATQPTTNYERPTATDAPSYNFEAPSVDTSLPSVAESLLDATQNAVNPNNKPTSNKPAPTKKPDKNDNAGAGSDTAKPNYKDTESGLNVKDLIDEDGKQVLGYRYSNDGYYYTDDKDCWQMNAGYNEVYDNMAPLTAMFIDQVRIRFNYGGKDWMVQLWKGQYGWLLVGAEIGLYTTDEGVNSGAVTDINHYNCADKEDWLYMSMDCYWAEGNNGHYKKVFSRPYAKYWWPTGFVKGQLTKYTWPRTELKMKGRITFKSAEMANLFVEELRKTGFVRAAGNASNQLVDDSYYQSGADVWFLWSTIYHDCFK
ncbi:MAG: DUF4474 domain-containing protein [Clostridia bacterium]|nr:DUF4474 domain-containing protein [Clostridia bacterium]